MSCSPTCSATSATGWHFASSATIASNRSVNPLPGRAHGTAPTSCARHDTREARHARHIRVDERLVLEEVQMTPHTLPHVMHWACLFAASLLGAVEARARLWKPIVMCSSRLLPVPSRNSTPDTIHRSGNCKAEVNSEMVSIPLNYPNALTSKQPWPTPNSERFEIL